MEIPADINLVIFTENTDIILCPSDEPDYYELNDEEIDSKVWEDKRTRVKGTIENVLDAINKFDYDNPGFWTKDYFFTGLEYDEKHRAYYLRDGGT